MIYLLTAIGLSPGGRSTVHIYTQTIQRTIQNKHYIEQYNNFGRVGAVHPLQGEPLITRTKTPAFYCVLCMLLYPKDPSMKW